ncbi:MAG: PilX N-terminal domain-containing pilus assembly protein [Gammaproteobacteria bacterium]
MPNQSSISPPAAQHGFVLVVALILLLVLTLLGLAAAQSTSLEERMSGNARNQDMALQAAEAGLRAGESCLNAGLSVCSNFGGDTGGTYLFDQSAPPTTPLWKTVDWSDAASVLSYSTVTASDIPSVATQPQIIIEQMPPVAAPGGNLGAQQFGGGAPTIQLYRITALGTGGDSTSTVMLQSMYGP